MKRIHYYILLLVIPLRLAAFEPTPVTPYPVVGFQEMAFFDTHQKLERKLLVWYPVDPLVTGTPSSYAWDTFQVAVNAPIVASKVKRPLILISHGLGGQPSQLSWLVRGLVHAGFAVAAVRHMDLIDRKAHLNHWQRAQDIHEIIDYLSVQPFAASLDMQKIGIAGFSLGGTTAIWIAGGRSTKLDQLIPTSEFASPEDYKRMDEALPGFNREMMAKDWRDERVKAAFIMAPGWAWIFDEESLRRIPIPTYLIAASADTVLVAKNNAGFFARSIPKALYQEIPGKADHYIFISALNDRQKKRADPEGRLTYLSEDDVSVDRTWIQLQLVEQAVGFFESALAYDPE